MPQKKSNVVKPTTMRIPDDLIDRTDGLAEKLTRSRSYLVIKWIKEGLARDEKRLSGGALD